MISNRTIKKANKISDNHNPVEFIKDESDYLRGSIAQGLLNPITGAMFHDDTMLIKFHGIYQQDDRDVRKHRTERFLEPAYSFMIRLRLPGGLLTAKQWTSVDTISNKQSIKTLKLTTRQAVQFHGILKRNLAKTIQEYDEELLDSIAGCGDVNRNVMCTPNPFQSKAHKEIYESAGKISKHLMPISKAYYEIFIDKKLIAGGEDKSEPLYGKQYLPRKFKIAIAIPPNNDVDVFANDIGLIAILKDDVLQGYNICVGGGMGMSHSDTTTYPRIATHIGFVSPEQVLDVCYHTVQIQRDYGNRVERKLARFKYTVDAQGLDWIKFEIERRTGIKILPTREYKFETNGDKIGWHKDKDEKLFLALHIDGGRVKDTEEQTMKSALREISDLDICDFRLTGNQNLILGSINAKNKQIILDILDKHNVLKPQIKLSNTSAHSIACVALNTCVLATAEAERFLPSVIARIDILLTKHGLDDKKITVRMTGCPNGCGRPYLAEIGFVGKALGRYNLYLGASHIGDRLNKLYMENIHERDIETILEPILIDYAKNQNINEAFGDFTIRAGYVNATDNGLDFHSNIKEV